MEPQHGRRRLIEAKNAVAALEQAYRQHDFGAIFIRVPEFYEVLSPDPRYHAILRKMGLESE